MVEGVLRELLHKPLAGLAALVPPVNARWDRNDLSVVTTKHALEPIVSMPWAAPLEAGHVYNQEAYLFARSL